MLDIKALIKEASEKGASDIHIYAGESPRFRIKGELISSGYEKLTPGDTLEVLLYLMDPVQRAIFEEKKEADLSVSIPEAGRIRVNAYRQRGSITITLRLVDSEIPEAGTLGIPENVLELCEERKGLILITGPSGSGKSTVTASLIDRINSERSCNIITLDDPIEFYFKNKKAIVNQREIGVDTIDLSTALESCLKQDPDVIGLGSIHSEEGAEAAIMAAETGRLVFASLYTAGAARTISYLIDMFPEQKRRQAANRLSNVLTAVLSRQLIRSGDDEMIPVYELLLNDNAVREMIRDNKTEELTRYMEENKEKGLSTMDGSIYSLCIEGRISKEEAVLASSDREAMAERLLN
ncbi:MAG: PilT/PilU family type 4a pilus ATPase [Lachnospiraceae bacterium]|nr:PilT/PilU family type 4a pilus ATPase [Lachnospiraceae bacterium]